MVKDYVGLIFDDFPSPIAVMDTAGTVVLANKAAYLMLGPLANAVKKGTFNIFKENLITDIGTGPGVRRALAGETVIYPELKIPQNKGASYTYQDVSIFPIVDETGAVIRVAAVGHDVTDRVEVKNALAESLVTCNLMTNSTIKSISRIIELRDPYTAGHQTRVSELACAIAADLGMSKPDIERMKIAGLVHDLGKILLPSEILSKPGALTDYEYAIVKKHPEAGLSVLEGTDFDQVVIDIVSQHHERIDGSGYPKALTGDLISPEAKIFAVADVVEAMAAHRPYRPSLGIAAALREIENNKGVLFDADVVDSCLRLFREKGFAFTELSGFYSGDTA